MRCATRRRRRWRSGRPPRPARRSCGTGPRARRAPRPKARPIAACSTPCAITRSGSPSGTWSDGSCTAPTTWSRAASRSGSGGRSWRRACRRSPTLVLRQVARARLLHTVSSGPAASRTDGPLLEQSRRRALRILLIGVAVVGLAAAVRLLVPPPPAPVRERSYAIPSPGRRITVEVLNGTKRSGAARAATRMLRGRGLDVVFFGNADTPSPIHPRHRPPRRSRSRPRRAPGARRGTDPGAAGYAAPGGRVRDSR